MAAADYAEGYSEEDDSPLPPPPELVLALQVDQWGAQAVYGPLPVPARDLRRMSACLNIYRAFASYKAGAHNLAQWAKSNPRYLEIVTEIREMRLADGR